MQINRSFVAIIASLAVAAVPAVAPAQVSVGVGVGFGGPGWAVGVVAGYPPPALPVYAMPPAPYPNWQWIPGYWGAEAPAIIGFRVTGQRRRRLATTGRPVIGTTLTALTLGTSATGLHQSDSTVELTMGSATSEPASSAASGRAALSTTIRPSSTSTERSSTIRSLTEASFTGTSLLVRA